ncbi:carbonic anhydrase 4 [Hyperolius riggenbachi]|uniref:carbonic anhydrase 4 n=1 Tax=Hyperolius riggenbachi TaxID=752182 RepID=UPI0035A2AF3F
MTFAYLCLFLSLHVIRVRSSEDWCYDILNTCDAHSCGGTQAWKSIEECGGNKQSPINIVTRKTVLDEKLNHIVFHGYDKGHSYALNNTGHSVQLTLTGPNDITISEGGLGGTYLAAQLHFHWGSTSTFGSEHSIDGERYPMELHIVHKKPTGRSAAGSSGEAGSIAVLGFFFEVQTNNNINFDPIIKELPKIQAKDSTVTLNDIILQNLIKDVKTDNYYRYEGSLTTPPCSEVVTWTVFPDPIKIGESQLKEFYTRVYYSSDAIMTDNFRPVQEIGSRTVYRSGVEAILSHSTFVFFSLVVAYFVSAP